MKNIIIGGIIVLAVGVFVPQMVRAQGATTYLSNLDQASTGSLAAGSDSWLAASFFVGNNGGGYVLNSIQLQMTDASGSPNGFTVMVYTDRYPYAIGPGSIICTLSGSANPAASGIFTYTTPPNITLFPASYFIVVTAGTAIANGAYEWSLAGANSYNPSGGWGAAGYVATSSNGSSWSVPTGGDLQFAVIGMAVPEPDISCLSVLGGLAFLWHRRKVGVV